MSACSATSPYSVPIFCAAKQLRRHVTAHTCLPCAADRIAPFIANGLSSISCACPATIKRRQRKSGAQKSGAKKRRKTKRKKTAGRQSAAKTGRIKTVYAQNGPKTVRPKRHKTVVLKNPGAKLRQTSAAARQKERNNKRGGFLSLLYKTVSQTGAGKNPARKVCKP